MSSTSTSQPSNPLAQAWQNNPQQITTMGLILLLCAALTFFGKGHKNRLATGHFSGGKEKAKAKNLFVKQRKQNRLTHIGLSIREPGEKGFLAVPDIQPGAIIKGIPGIGKTASVINPLLRSAIKQGHRIILFDWKYPAQSSELVPYAASLGYEVTVYAPGFPESAVINPLDLMSGPEDLTTATELAKTIATNLRRESQGKDEFFGTAGEVLLSSVFCVAKSTPYPDLPMAQKILSLPNLVQRLEAARINPLVHNKLGQFFSGRDSEKQTAGIVATALSPLTSFMEGDDLIRSYAGSTSCKLDLGPKQMLVVGMDRRRSQVLSPLLASVLHLVIQRNLVNGSGTPLVLGLDEVSTLYLPLKEWLNQYRSSGLCALLGIQNLSQLENTYGKENARAIFGGCPTKFFFNPGEIESAKMISEWLGDEEISYKTKSRGRSNGKRSINVSPQERTRRLFEASKVLKLPQGKAVCINPAYMDKEDGFIPVKHQFTYTKKDEAMEDQCRQQWEKYTCPALMKRAPKTETFDFSVRRRAIKKVMPDTIQADAKDPKKLAAKVAALEKRLATIERQK